MDPSITHKMTREISTGFSSWSSTLSSSLKMLIVPSLLFAISFLIQVAVLAAPLSLDGVSINARVFHDGPAGGANAVPHPSQNSESSMFALLTVCSLPLLMSYNPTHPEGNPPSPSAPAPQTGGRDGQHVSNWVPHDSDETPGPVGSSEVPQSNPYPHPRCVLIG